DADADRALLRQPATRPRRYVGAVRAGSSRHLGVLERADGMDAGWAGRDPWDERAVVDRSCDLERLHPAAERHVAPGVRPRCRRDAGDNPRVRRALAVVAPPSTRGVSGVVKGATGLLASRVASSDDPVTHVSYDLNIDIT